MSRYLLGRVMQLIPVLLIISSVVFAIMHVLPGDPAELMLAGAEGGAITPERLAEIKEQMGLNDPLVVQYLRFLGGAVIGDLGESIRFHTPVTSMILDRFGYTISLSVGGLLVSLAIGLPLGMLAAVRQNSWIDAIAMIVAYVGASMPVYWVGLVLILLFSFDLGWFPPAGADSWRSLVLPALTLGIVSAGMICRLVRSSMVEVLSEDYIRSARAKGLGQRLILWRHGLKNALIPVVTMLGLQFGAMLAGAVVIETVFSRPGVGRLVVSAILQKDYPLVQGCVVFLAAVYLLVNLLVDLGYAWLDPRIRYGVWSMPTGTIAQVPAATKPDEQPVDKARKFHRLRILARNKGAVIGSILLLFWCIVALLGPAIVPHDPLEMLSRPRLPPSAKFWLGTDLLGRDLLSRILVGSQISLQLGIISVILGGLPGVLIGLVAGYCGGRGDILLSRFIDALLALPSILLALVMIAALGPSIRNVMISVGIATMPLYARLVRGSVLSIKEMPYVEAARVIGNPAWRVMLFHVLVNAYAPVLVLSTLQVGNAILVGSGLSFLGLGAQPPIPEWGLMSAEGREVLNRAWWISTFPGLAILSVVVACNLVGDGLRSALDPRMRMEK